jgi:hypothetical protein
MKAMLNRMVSRCGVAALGCFCILACYNIGHAKENALVVVETVTASSFDPGSNKYPHTPSQAVDGDPHSCWSSQSNITTNQWLELHLSEPTRISVVRIRNGWTPRGYPNWMKTNHRAKDITLTFDGKSSQKATLPDTNMPQSIAVSNSLKVTTIRIAIDTIYH